jgi:pyridoxine 4-dehydrogenase
VQQRRLGAQGPEVSTIGLGCMGLSGAYGPVDEAEGVAVVHAALDAGITLLDTADFYGMGHNELLLGKAIAGRRQQVFLALKFGPQRGPDGAFIGVDARRSSVQNFLAYSLRRLGTDYVDLYQPARVDPAVPIEETVGAIADLVRAGYVRHVGLSEASAATVRRAHTVYPIAALQTEYSLASRGIEADILPAARTLGIGVTAYGVLSRGLLTGSTPDGATDLRRHLPRFSPDNLRRNRPLAEALGAVAAELGATPAQVAIAWTLARGADIVPLIGARRRAQLAEALSAIRIVLGADDVARIEAAVPDRAVAGERYGPAQMRWLDSEREGA